MSFRSALVAQFRQPTGSLGHLAGWIMSHRASNVERSLGTVSLLEIGDGDEVLEIGSGPGLAIERASQLTHASVVGVDHSEVMHRVASRRNRQAIRDGRVQLHCAAVSELPALGMKFDVIFTVNCLMFWPDPVATLSELRGSSKPGGRIAVTHQPRKPGATIEDVAQEEAEVASQLGKAGFAGIRVERLDLQPVPASCVIGQNPG